MTLLRTAFCLFLSRLVVKAGSDSEPTLTRIWLMGNCIGGAEESSFTRPTLNARASRANNLIVGERAVRKQLFEPSANQEDVDLTKILKDKKLDVESRLLIQKALSKFFGDENAKNKMKLVIGAMEREFIPADKVIIVEGEPGDKLYIIEKGELEITIAGRVVRTMARGDMVGELALLYDAPRSATVRTMTEVVAWTLSREHFKGIQVASTSAVQLQRAKWLVASTDLATLSPINISKLIAVMQEVKYASGDRIYTEGEPTDQVVLIESGRATLQSSAETAGQDAMERDKLLGIVRPKVHTRNLADLDASEFADQLQRLNDDSSLDAGSISVDLGDVDLSPGCLLGINGLRAKAGLDTCGVWKWDEATKTTASPFTVIADGPVEALVFTRKVFEKLFGENSIIPSNKKNSVDIGERTLRKFDQANFKMKYVLGSGSFGVVVYAESREDPTSKTFYALKFLSKVDVVVTGQLKHVEDERRLLSMMDSPFILKLYGTYQTPHQIVFVTEAITNGDLWSVIYEQFVKTGLPLKLVLFYAASIVMAMSHIHTKGMAYRDLKPENIMIDSNGYAKIIDFGFAKMIPYVKDNKVYAKSYTLCGTPEYLAPEFVFNLGHDHSADLWALGILIYEMFLVSTPFVPKRADNITELFNNIASTKTSGVKLTPKLDDRAKTKNASDLILRLLRPQPSERMGVQEGYTNVILEHQLFTNFDMEALITCSLKPVHIPPVPRNNASISTLPAIKAFKGDQSQFEFF